MFFLALTNCPHSIYFEEDSSMETWQLMLGGGKDGWSSKWDEVND